MSRPDVADRYRETTGHEPPPPVPEDHPLAWQWDYRGTREEREALRDDLFAEPERGEQPEQEEALF